VTYHAAEVLWRHAAVSSRMAVFSVEWSDPSKLSWGPQSVLWLALLVAFAAAARWLALQPPDERPPGFRQPALSWALGAALAVAALRAPRTHPYFMMFLTPILSAGAAALWRHSRLAVAAAAVSLATLGLWNEQNLPIVRGAGVSARQLPVRAAAFLKAAHPKPGLLNWNSYGSYLADVLPEDPVATDGRIPLFLDFLEEFEASPRLPELLARHDFNIILWKMPEFDPKELKDPHLRLAPSKDWAVVFADNAAIVYVRRVPENAALIAAHEYRALYRGVPAVYPGLFESGTPEFRRLFEQELDRCLAEAPDSDYCILGKAAFHLKRHEEAQAAALLKTRTPRPGGMLQSVR
jgi:hypothetical protein